MNERRSGFCLATWNCFGAPQNLEDFLEGRPFWPERLTAPAVIRALSRHDVVCVQENFVSGVRDRLAIVAEAAGFSVFWHDAMGPDGEDKTIVGGGLALLSRLPLTARFHRLPRGVGADGFARKGFVVSQVRLPGGRELCLVNTHLQADDGRASPEECVSTRWAQLEALRDALSEPLAGGVPVIVCGDLNVAHGTDEYARTARLFGEGLVDLAGEAGFCTYDTAENDVARAFHEGGPERALIDYVWTSRDRISVKRASVELTLPLEDLEGAPAHYAGRPFASDHFGVAVEVEID